MNTPIANMIAEMHGKGIPVEFIVSAVATLEEAMAAKAVSTGQQDTRPVDTSTIDKRRAWDRERKRHQRELKRLAEMSALSTGQSTGIHRNPPDDASILSSKEEDSIKIEVKEKKESKRIARGTRIPPDFAINDEDRAFAASLGIPPDTVEAETPQFIDYWSSVAGASGVKLSWKGTWRNRMRNLLKYGRTANVHQIAAKPLTEFQRKQQETNDVRAQLRNYANGGGSGGNTDRILPDDHGERPESLRSGPRPALLAISGASDRSRT